MNVVNVSLQVLPVVEEEMIYPVVDKVIDYIKSTGVKYFVSPMETTMEGDIDILLNIVKKAQDICVKEGEKRVVSIVKIDYKPDGVTIDEKMNKYISK
ncbi:thiamine-binding protein [Thermoanaerobacterium thermosaccharolyticum]|uniref:thiamine-binding protein n=1 Tax=Thermoanaerobacterium thermosaccharolyticum TaxID=1517 RepID=UPI003D279663